MAISRIIVIHRSVTVYTAISVLCGICKVKASHRTKLLIFILTRQIFITFVGASMIECKRDACVSM